MFTGTSLEVKLVRSWNFPVGFGIVGWDITHDFVLFCLTHDFPDLGQLSASFLATNILFSWRVFDSNSS